MKALYILAAVILVLFLIGQIRVGGQAEFNAQGFFLWIRLGKIRIKILPMKPKEKEESQTPQEPQEPQSPQKPKKTKKPKKEKPPTPLPEKIGGALEYAQALLPVALEAAGGLWRGLRVDTLDLELTAGADDPADAAMLYGQANAALGALWYPLTKAFRVKDGSARVNIDFNTRSMTLYGAAALSIKIGTAVWIGLRAGLKALFRALAAKKRIKIKRQQRKAA